MSPGYRTTAAERRKFEKGLVEGTGRGGTGLFDTWGMTEGLFGLGGKAKDVEQILNDPGTKYTPGQGYNLNWWQRNVSKITDQDIANARMNREREALEAKYGDDAEKYGIDITGTTSRADLNSQLETAKAVKEKKDELSGFGSYGSAAKAELGLEGNLTPAQLNAAIVRANELKTAADPETQLRQAQIKESIDASKAGTKLQQDQLAQLRQHQADTISLQRDQLGFQEEQFGYTKERDFTNDKNRRIERQEDIIRERESRQDDIKLRMYEIDAYNQNQEADREYRRKLHQQNKSQDLVNAMMQLTAAFSL